LHFFALFIELGKSRGKQKPEKNKQTKQNKAKKQTKNSRDGEDKAIYT